MSFQIDLDPFDRAYAHFVRHVREAIQRTFEDGVRDGLSQKEIADTLGIDESLVSRRLNGPGNITLRTLCDLYTAMGREPLANFGLPYKSLPVETPRSSRPIPNGPNTLVDVQFRSVAA